jgi:mannose/cellobiose epimerase-like protein (N-acyl-D-glucosamine 2-epimerase family)
MHLLEAALAWLAIDPTPVWRHLADEIVALCRGRFIDRDTGALREWFASDWTPSLGIPGEILEPGHHYEWAFLLDRWAKRTGRSRPAEVSKLVAFADANGLDRKRRVAVNGIKLDGSVADPIARLWPQTERIRAYLIDRHDGDQARLREATESLSRYLDAPLPGWHGPRSTLASIWPKSNTAFSPPNWRGTLTCQKSSRFDYQPNQSNICRLAHQVG